MSGRSPLTRRSFLTTSAAAALAAPALGAQGANERINIGLIGTGGRCRHLMGALAKVPNTRMMALCDVYEPNLELAPLVAVTVAAAAFTSAPEPDSRMPAPNASASAGHG